MFWKKGAAYLQVFTVKENGLADILSFSHICFFSLSDPQGLREVALEIVFITWALTSEILKYTPLVLLPTSK